VLLSAHAAATLAHSERHYVVHPNTTRNRGAPLKPGFSIEHLAKVATHPGAMP